MKQKVEFELLSDVICAGVKVADNFLESEPYIKGSVLRAAFANEVLLECPLADAPSSNGRYNFIEIKDSEGKCKECAHRKICEHFSDMTFSFAYKNDVFPAPFTAKVCKKCGTMHSVKDTIYENGVIACDECTGKIKRMENLKGFIKLTGNRRVSSEKTEMSLSTHTAINYYSDTTKDGSLFSIKAIRKGQRFTAVIDDMESGMLYEGAVIYAGKYSSNGYGKLKIVSLAPADKITEDTVKTRICGFNKRFGTDNKAALLCLSDMCVEADERDDILDNAAYTDKWTRLLFGDEDMPFSIDTVFAETQLYSGYDTSKKWGSWRSTTPDMLVLKGTSILITIKDGRFDEAVKKLAEIEKNGIGKKCSDGYGRIAVCHEIHCLGVN